MGVRTEASGTYSIAAGGYSKALGTNGATAMGYYANAAGNSSFALGNYTKTNSYAMTAVGRYNTAEGTNVSSWQPSEPIFVVGIGTGESNRKNAITVLKSGRVGLQTVTSPTYALHLPNSTTNGEGRAQANAWNTYSDTRVKSNQQPIQYGLTQISKWFLKPTFTTILAQKMVA